MKPRAPSSESLHHTPLVLFLIATLSIKAVVLAQLHGHPLLQPAGTLDSAVYVDLGRRVAAGDPALGPEPYFVAPLYIYFLGLVFFLSGGSLLAAKIVQIVLGTLAVGLVQATARHWFDGRAAWIAAGLVAATGVCSEGVASLTVALRPRAAPRDPLVAVRLRLSSFRR